MQEEMRDVQDTKLMPELKGDTLPQEVEANHEVKRSVQDDVAMQEVVREEQDATFLPELKGDGPPQEVKTDHEVKLSVQDNAAVDITPTSQSVEVFQIEAAAATRNHNKEITSDTCTDLVIAEAPLSSLHEDRETFSGLRITDREFPEEKWIADIRNRPKGQARVVPFTRLVEFSDRQQALVRDKVVIGVLFENVPDKLANGQLCLRWQITDLATPEPRCLTLQIMGQAFAHWHDRKNRCTAVRGAIFAVMNPVLLQCGDSHNSEFQFRVDKVGQLLKLGMCPSLGSCKMKGCKLPCNADRKQRFCSTHLSLLYAEKLGRQAMGGTEKKLNELLLRSKRKAVSLDPLDRPEKSEEEKIQHVDEEVLWNAIGAAKDGMGDEVSGKRAEAALKRLLSKHETKQPDDVSTIALRFDERRRSKFVDNEDYIRAIRTGNRCVDAATSRVPMLGRGIKADSEEDLQVDLGEPSRDEEKKAERMLEQRAEQANLTKADPEEYDMLQPAKRPRTKVAKSAPEQSLGELVKALSTKRMARRPDAKENAQETGAGVSITSKSATKLTARFKENAQEIGAGVSVTSKSSTQIATVSTGGKLPVQATQDMAESVERARSLLKKLEAVGEDIEQFRLILEAGADLSDVAVAESGLYHAVGRMALQTSRQDIKHVLMQARRHWRSQSIRRKEERQTVGANVGSDTGAGGGA